MVVEVIQANQATLQTAEVQATLLTAQCHKISRKQAEGKLQQSSPPKKLKLNQTQETAKQLLKNKFLSLHSPQSLQENNLSLNPKRKKQLITLCGPNK